MTSEPDWLRPMLAKVYARKWGDEGLPDFATLQDKFVRSYAISCRTFTLRQVDASAMISP
jgi:hypothetical protein